MEIVFAMNRSLVNKIVTVLLLDEALEDEDDSHSTRGKTRKWMKRRHRQGYHNNLVKELLAEDTRTYEELMTFLAILSAVEADVTPRNKAGGAEPVSAEERLTIAIRFFATGETFVPMEKQFRVSQRAISYITLEVSSAIIRHLGPTYLKAPNSPEEWRQMPLCLGAIDGKHVAIRPPANSGSWYFNYKKTFSIILMAIAGPDYECLYADLEPMDVSTTEVYEINAALKKKLIMVKSNSHHQKN